MFCWTLQPYPVVLFISLEVSLLNDAIYFQFFSTKRFSLFV